MKKLILNLAIISLITCVLSIILYSFLYSNTNDLEYKMMELEPGWHFHKLIGVVPESYKKQFSINTVQENENFTLFEISKLEYCQYLYYYIRFKNKNEGFLKGYISDPSRGYGNYFCSAINIQLFNEYIYSNGIINEDRIKTEYINLLRNKSANDQSFARIESTKQMKFFLQGTPLWKGDTQDTIDVESLKISFDKELVYWIQHRGFFKFKFSFKDDHKVNSVDCEDIGSLDCRLLSL